MRFPVKITLFSFGFKHGFPEADMVLDVRFLPNPYWVPELKPHSGCDPRVALYALGNESGRSFLEYLEPFLDFLLKEHAARDREQLAVAIGCTGGKHRSVAVVEHLRRFLDENPFPVEAFHRDVEKE